MYQRCSRKQATEAADQQRLHTTSRERWHMATNHHAIDINLARNTDIIQPLPDRSPNP